MGWRDIGKTIGAYTIAPVVTGATQGGEWVFEEATGEDWGDIFWGEKPDEQKRAEMEALLRSELGRDSPYEARQLALANELQGVASGQTMGSSQRAAQQQGREALARLYGQAASARGYGGAMQRGQIMRQAPLAEGRAQQGQAIAAMRDSEAARAQQGQILSGLQQQEQMRRAQMMELLLRQQQGADENLKPGMAPYIANAYSTGGFG